MHFLLIVGSLTLGLQANGRKKQDSGDSDHFLSDNLFEGKGTRPSSAFSQMEATEGTSLDERDPEIEMPRRFRFYPVVPKKVLQCSPDLIGMFFETKSPQMYAPYLWNINITKICPNLEETCCEAHLLIEKQKEFEQNYARLIKYRVLEEAIQTIPLAARVTDQEYEEALMVSGIDILRHDLPFEKAIDLFLTFFKRSKTSLLRVLNPLAEYYSGFICQFCHINSLQYFSFDVQQSDQPRNIVIREEEPIFYLNIAAEYLNIERAYALAYSLLQRSKEFRERFPEPIDFDPEEDYQHLTSEIKTCIKLHKVRFETYRRPSCMYVIERLAFKTRVEGLGWVKAFLTQVIAVLGARLKKTEEMKKMAEDLPLSLQFWQPNTNVTLDFNTFATNLNYSTGLSMTERPIAFSFLTTGSAGALAWATISLLVSLLLK